MFSNKTTKNQESLNNMSKINKPVTELDEKLLIKYWLLL